jgi:hypothetical protein
MLGLATIKVLASWQPYCQEFLAGRLEELRNLQMSEVKSSSVRSAHSEMIARLISAGEQRNDRDAITNAIARMKLDVRTGNGRDGPPAGGGCG